MRPISLSKPSKYRNRKTRRGGLMFDSKLETERWLVLKDKERRGEIYNLKRQTVYPLKSGEIGSPVVTKICDYKPDFEYMTGPNLYVGRVICEDCKGVSTDSFRIKAKLFRANYPHIELRIIKAKDVAT